MNEYQRYGLIGITIMLLIFIGIAINLTIGSSSQCDVGEESVAGDFRVVPDTFYNQRACAVKDCGAYNNYHGGIGCVV